MADRPLPRQAPIFVRKVQPAQPPPPSSSAFPSSDPFVPLPSSSQATPLRPQPPQRILAVDIPIASLRPLAFRVFTKKHGLTLKSEALSALCTFVGRKCGAEWRDSGKGEQLLDEIARGWKRNEGPKGILVEGGERLDSVLRALDMPHDSKGALVFKRQGSNMEVRVDASGDVVMEEGDKDELSLEALEDIEPKKYLKVVDGFRQPNFNFNLVKKQFERAAKPLLLPAPKHKSQMFKNRYNILHQRLLRNENFLPPTFQGAQTARTAKSYFKITPICNLLGRAGQGFLIFGILTVSAAGQMSLVDPTGEIVLNLQEAKDMPRDGAWYVPGCFVLADGIFEEDGTFSVYTLGQPPCERRDASGEIFGHVDFLGTGVTLDMGCTLGGGSQGRAMRRVEKGLDNVRFIALCDVELDVPKTYTALRRIFDLYADDPPLVCILAGNFTSVPFGAKGGTIAYKEHFNELAALLAEYPNLVESTTFIFVPGDNDPSISSSTGGASPLLPRRPVPDIFTNRVRARLGKNAVFTSNPTRVGYFSQEIVVARDKMTARFRRHAIKFAGQEKADEEGEAETNGNGKDDQLDASVKIGRKLVRTVLSQANLSPLPLSLRPVLWDFAHSLNLYPLPTTLILADPTAPPFSVTYEGCCVLNPGRLIDADGRSVRWVEYWGKGGGNVRETTIL